MPRGEAACACFAKRRAAGDYAGQRLQMMMLLLLTRSSGSCLVKFRAKRQCRWAGLAGPCAYAMRTVTVHASTTGVCSEQAAAMSSLATMATTTRTPCIATHIHPGRQEHPPNISPGTTPSPKLSRGGRHRAPRRRGRMQGQPRAKATAVSSPAWRQVTFAASWPLWSLSPPLIAPDKARTDDSQAVVVGECACSCCLPDRTTIGALRPVGRRRCWAMPAVSVPAVATTICTTAPAASNMTLPYTLRYQRRNILQCAVGRRRFLLTLVAQRPPPLPRSEQMNLRWLHLVPVSESVRGWRRLTAG